MNDTRLFEFESDFVESLRCIPMAVRFKLDRCGIKLSLRQWSRLTLDDRRDLRARPCDNDEEVATYRGAVVDLVQLRADEPAKALTTQPCGVWDDCRQAAPVVVNYARTLDLRPPSDAAWARLTQLERFVLVKLTRDNHDNINFAPAMREFGLEADFEAVGI